MAAYPDPPPVILLPEYYIAAHIAAQAAYQLRYKNTQYYSWVGLGVKCFHTESSRFSFTSLFIQ